MYGRDSYVPLISLVEELDNVNVTDHSRYREEFENMNFEAVPQAEEMARVPALKLCADIAVNIDITVYRFIPVSNLILKVPAFNHTHTNYH